VVDLGNGFAPTSSVEFFNTKQPGEEAATITQTLPLNELEAG
jgi:hypothetical protein